MEKYKKLIEKQREYITYLMKLIRMYNIVWDISLGARGNYESEIYDIEKEIKEEPDQDLPSDEDIEEYFTTQHYDNKNGHHYRVKKDRVYGAKAMRDGKIKSNRK